MRKFENGTIVYVNTTYTVAEEGVVEEYFFEKQTQSNWYKVHSHIGSFGVLENKVFATKQEALDTYHKEFDETVKKIESEIKSVEDLLNLPLKYCLNGDCVDYEALRAYRNKAKELMGIDLPY